MRVLVDVPEEELGRLNQLGELRKVSRAHLIRCAVSQFLAKESEDALSAVFGIWADRNIDALEYQEQMRREWERES